jgi:hypothetical protein
MQQNKSILPYAGAFLFLLASTSYAADMPSDTMVNPPPPDRMTTSDRMAADRALPCADQPGDATLSSDCDRLKRRMGDSRTPSERTALGTSMAVCTSHTDAKGNVIYDDPTCPARNPQTVTSPEKVYLIKENPFFNLHITKAEEHARAAEIAGNQGQAPELLQHAQMSLDQAKEAQRAGNVPGLNEGIISLREALRLPEASSVREATAYVRDARKNLAQAGGLKFVEVRPQGAVATR